jgi:hypothetical protein
MADSCFAVKRDSFDSEGAKGGVGANVELDEESKLVSSVELDKGVEAVVEVEGGMGIALGYCD